MVRQFGVLLALAVLCSAMVLGAEGVEDIDDLLEKDFSLSTLELLFPFKYIGEGNWTLGGILLFAWLLILCVALRFFVLIISRGMRRDHHKQTRKKYEPVTISTASLLRKAKKKKRKKRKSSKKGRR